MDYFKKYHQIVQDAQLGYRQAKADQQHSPQHDEGSLEEARERLIETEYDARLDGSSMEVER